MAAFIAMTSWRGEFTDDYFAQPTPDPVMFGMPTEDDGSRDDPLLSGRSWAVTSCSASGRACSRATTAASWTASSDTPANPRRSRASYEPSSTTTDAAYCLSQVGGGGWTYRLASRCGVPSVGGVSGIG